MATATLKKATKELGLSPDDMVHYYKKGNKRIIEAEFEPENKQKKNDDVNAFETILNMAENLGIEDLAENHDHYIYGTPKREDVDKE